VRYLIEHESVLRFGAPVREHHWELRLAPRAGAELHVLRCEVTMSPETELREHVDCFGNRVHRGSLMAPHEQVSARLVAEVETRLANPFDYAPLPVSEERPWLERRLREDPSLHDYLEVPVDALPALDALPSPRHPAGTPLLESVQRAMAFAQERFRYEPGATGVHAPLAEFVARGAGVCQDFAHLLVALVRAWGFPARYVAGYVDPGAGGEEWRETTHAWVEVLVPGAGWRGFDATHGLVVDELYVPAAVGRDSRDAAPMRGTFKGDAHHQSPEVLLRVARQEQRQEQ
jgi:transglutaminase-like putative cysteine protease